MKAPAATANQQRPTEEPVDVLVNLAKEGEIDPWDIDIVEVTDKFLDRLDEADLARSGRGILYASILLRMKSDYLVEEDGDDEPDDEGPMELGWNAEAEGPGGPQGPAGPDPIDRLEREFERRLDRKRVRDRSTPETLDELVRELRERERGSWWKEHREYDTSEDAVEIGGGGAVAQPTTEDAMETAHEDDIEAHIDDVWARLAEEFEARNEILFRELLPADAEKHDVIVTFLSCLFLANRGRLGLEQDELYGDLWLQSKE